MKRLNYFVSAALAIVFAASCEPQTPEVVDYPIEGNFTISAEYSAYVHGGGYGWRNGEQIGVFVTSEGVTQANLLYTPSDTSKVEILTGTNPYTGEEYELEDRSYVGDVELTPASTAAGFKKGDHVIYAYTPYVASAADYTAVPLPNLAAQQSVEDAWAVYGFGYTKTKEAISEYSSANISLGNFTPVFYPLSVKSIELTEEQGTALKDQKITAVKFISTELDIALTDASINLATGEISGNKSKTIEITFPEGLEIEFEAGFPPYYPDAYILPGVTVYANINPANDLTVRQEEYAGANDEVNYKDVTCLKGSFTVVYTIGGIEYTATTLSGVNTLGGTDEYMAFPLTPTLQ